MENTKIIADIYEEKPLIRVSVQKDEEKIYVQRYFAIGNDSRSEACRLCFDVNFLPKMIKALQHTQKTIAWLRKHRSYTKTYSWKQEAKLYPREVNIFDTEACPEEACIPHNTTIIGIGPRFTIKIGRVVKESYHWRHWTRESITILADKLSELIVALQQAQEYIEKSK